MPIARARVVPGAWLVEYLLHGARKVSVKRLPTEDKARAFYRALFRRMCDWQTIRQEQILAWIPGEKSWHARGPKYVYSIKVRARDPKDLRLGYYFILAVKGAKLTPSRPEFPSLQAAQRFAAGIL
jgi:hypothetical protein